MQRLGKAYIKIDGDLLETMPGAKIDIGGDKRDPVVGSHTVHGYAEAIMPSRVDCEISVGPNTSLAKIRDITDATVTFECDTGQVYIVRNAWVSETLTVTEGEGGKVPIVLMGPPAEETA